jgi:hypothetical protein
MKNRSTQSDTNMDFDGMARTGTGRVNQKVHTNQWSGHMNDGREVNMGRGPTKGNMGCGKPGKPGAMTSVTKDSFRAAPTDSLPSSTKIKNPDYINGGAQVRTPGGTRTWDPKCGQNYAGNPDRIRIDQGGGGSFNREGPSKTPATRGGSTNFNFGPKSQY